MTWEVFWFADLNALIICPVVALVTAAVNKDGAAVRIHLIVTFVLQES
jgi:hypothetical protein